MKRRSVRLGRFALVFLGVAAVLQAAYRTPGNPGPIGRAVAGGMLELRIWSGFEDNAGIDSVDGPGLAIREALDGWARVSSLPVDLGPTTDVSTAGRDGVSLVTIADEPSNRSLVGDFLGTTLFWTQTGGQGNEIVEADVVFNPHPDRRWSTIEGDDAYSLFDVAQHEFGHVAGLGHSISRGSRLFVFSGGFDYGRGLISGADFSAINELFPLPGIQLITGAIAGKVTKEGAGVYGGFVLAVDASGTLAGSAITSRNGSYRLQFLPPGRYTVYAEPLDGPTMPANLANPNITPGQVDTEFIPRFHEDSLEPLVQVSAGDVTAGVNIAVETGTTSLDPDFIGVNPDANGTLLVNTLPATVSTATTTNLILAGKGSGQLSTQGAEVVGSGLRTGDLSRTATNSDGVVFKVYPLHSSPEAASGNYTLALQGSSAGVVTGGLKVFPADRFLHIFSQFVASPGSAASRVLMVNPDPDSPVTGTLAPRSREGLTTPLSLGVAGSPGRGRFSLPPGGLLVAETDPDSQFVGSLSASADGPMGSVLLVETSAGTTGVAAGSALRSFVAPVEVAASGRMIDTGVAIANLDPRPAKVHLRLQNTFGVTQGSTIIDLPGHGQTARLVGEWIPLPDSDFTGTLLATSTRQIGATVIRLAPGVFTTFPVIQSRVLNRSYFAQFANQGPLSSDLLLLNPSSTGPATGVVVQARRSDGNTTALTLNGEVLQTGRIELQIPPLGLSKLSSGGGDFVGSIEVTSTSPVGGVVLFRSDGLGTAGVGESRPSHKLVVPIDRHTSLGADTGVALFNTEARPVTATLTVRDEAGRIVAGPKPLSLSSNQQLASFPNQPPLDLGLGDTFTGTLWVEADGELAVTVIRESPGVLTTFPSIARELFVTPRK